LRIIETDTYTQLGSLVLVFDGAGCLEQWLDFIEQLDTSFYESHATSWTDHECVITLTSTRNMQDEANQELLADTELLSRDDWQRVFIMDTEGGQDAGD